MDYNLNQGFYIFAYQLLIMNNRYFLEISFNGSNYHGWQVQPGQITVQGELNRHISIILGEKVNCIGCGRTDAGVHARGFMLHFDTSETLDDQFRKKLNRFIHQDISVNKIFENKNRIHARYDAIERSYEYILSKGKDPFLLDMATITYESYHTGLMNEACKVLLEYEDFECFSKTHNSHKHYLCQLKSASWEETGGQYIFRITSNRFLRSMIRMLVGTMIQVGREKISLNEFREIIESKDRQRAGKSVHAAGLYFLSVQYPENKLELC